MKKVSLLILILLFSIGFLFSQVAINSDATAPDGSAMLDVKSNSKGILVPRMTLTERNNVSSPSTGLMIYQTDQTPGFYYYNGTIWTSVAGSGQHYVGELFGGGIVFWVDNTGQHGLVVSLDDLSSGTAWDNVGTLIGAGAQSDWDGLSNSNAIVGQPAHTNSAAKLCLDYINPDYGTGIFNDWYLPSRGELSHLWNNLFEVQKAIENDGNPLSTKLTIKYYWCSTEREIGNNAFREDFSGTNGNDYTYKSNVGSVRAIRTF